MIGSLYIVLCTYHRRFDVMYNNDRKYRHLTILKIITSPQILKTRGKGLKSLG